LLAITLVLCFVQRPEEFFVPLVLDMHAGPAMPNRSVDSCRSPLR
jgi:hypothetical protein